MSPDSESPHRQQRRSKIGGWPLTVALAVIFVFLFYIRHILTPFVFAAALAFVLTPPIDWMQKKLRIPRWIVAAAVYLIILALVVLPILFYGGTLVHDLSGLGDQAPALLHKDVADMTKLLGPSAAQSIDASKFTDDILADARAFVQSGTMLTVAGYGVGILFGIILSLVVLAYFLISGKRIAAGIFWLVPPEYRHEIDLVAAKILPLLWRYFFGLMVVVAYTSTLAWIAFGPIFKIPHAVILALVVGVLELIPLIGPAMTLAIVGIISTQEGSLVATLSLFAFAIALRLSLDEFVGPLVLGQAARLHPATIIFAFLSGGALFGVIGLLLAVPVAASIKIILTIYYAEPVKREPARR
jgi:predicted PurR-regulated permease PerM